MSVFAARRRCFRPLVLSSWVLLNVIVTVGCKTEEEEIFFCEDRSAVLPSASVPKNVCTTHPTSTELLTRHAVPHRNQLGYDPLQAGGLELLAPAGFDLSSEEQSILQTRGFVILDHLKLPQFPQGYANLYRHHLPLYVSADSILEAIHRSYDDILAEVETRYLAKDLDALLRELRQQMAKDHDGFSPSIVADSDLHLAVALSLLRGELQEPVAGASPDDIARYHQAAQQASGPASVRLWDVERTFDFSQLKPRGHYDDSANMRQYFRAVKWLGGLTLPMLHPDPQTHQLVLHRGAFEGSLLISRLFTNTALCRWRSIDMVVSAFVGAPQQMTIEQLQALLREQGITTPAELAAKSDDELRAAVLAPKYGAPAVASEILRGGNPQTGSTPQPRSFVLLNQRYTLDGQVLTEVTYDRIASGSVMRLMPSPLDVAFAALGNDQAAQLLSSELASYAYAPSLQCVRELVDGVDGGSWNANLYNTWLSALRTLSPTSSVSDPAAHGMPSVTGTEAWGRRLLSTQLASWAELKHDTLLYAAPAYAAAVACEFPAAYVEPYPEFFRAIGRWAAVGQNALAALQRNDFNNVVNYFIRVQEVAGMLAEMADFQRAGRPFSGAHMTFINELVQLQSTCGGPNHPGWYTGLYFNPARADEWKPVVADIFTQPSDALGNSVGRVLHVGTGQPRYMVVTVDGCSGAKAYVGLVSSYREVITRDYSRLDDSAWRGMIEGATPPGDVPWMQDLIGR